MGRRIMAGTTAGTALVWLVVLGVKLSSGMFGRQAHKVETSSPPHGRDYAVTVGIVAVAFVLLIICRLLMLAIQILHGSPSAGRTTLTVAIILLLATIAAAVKQPDIGQWLGVAMDLALCLVIALGLRRAARQP
jgi:hypothetical protein